MVNHLDSVLPEHSEKAIGMADTGKGMHPASSEIRQRADFIGQQIPA